MHLYKIKKLNHHLVELSWTIFEDLITNSNTSKARLKDIANVIMGQSPKSNTYNNDGIGLPLLNGATDFRGKIHPSKWTTDPKKVVHSGEYIFGVRATIGLTTRVFDTYAIGRGTGSALAKNDIYDEFLFFILEQLFKFFQKSGSGTVYVNISRLDFENYEFALPDKKTILSFHKTVKPFFDIIYANNFENKQLIEIRDSLLPRLLSGEDRVI